MPYITWPLRYAARCCTMCAPTRGPLGAPKASLVKGRGTAAVGGGGGIPYQRSISDFRNPPAPPGHPPLARGTLLRGSLPSYMAPPLWGSSRRSRVRGVVKGGHPLRPLRGHLPHKGGGFSAPNYCGQPLKIVRFHTFNGNGALSCPFVLAIKAGLGYDGTINNRRGPIYAGRFY